MANITQFGYEKFDYMDKINRFINQGKYTQALKFSRICLKHTEEKDRLPLILAIANCYMVTEEYEFAVKVLLEGLEIDRNNTKLIYLLSVALYYADQELASKEYYFTLYYYDDRQEVDEYLSAISELYAEEEFFANNKSKLVLFDESLLKDKYMQKAIGELEDENYQQALDILEQYDSKVPNDLDVLELFMHINWGNLQFKIANEYADKLLSLDKFYTPALKTKILIAQSEDNAKLLQNVIEYINGLICEDFGQFIDILNVIFILQDNSLIRTFILNHNATFEGKYFYLHISILFFLSIGDFIYAEKYISLIKEIYGDTVFLKFTEKYLSLLKVLDNDYILLMRLSDEVNNLDVNVIPYMRVPNVYNRIIEKILLFNSCEKFNNEVIKALKLSDSVELFELLVSIGNEKYIDIFFENIIYNVDINKDVIIKIIDKLNNKFLYLKAKIVTLLIEKFKEKNLCTLNNYKYYESQFVELDKSLIKSPILRSAYTFTYAVCMYSAKFFESDLITTVEIIYNIYMQKIKEDIDFRVYSAVLFYFLNLHFDEEFVDRVFDFFGIEYKDVCYVIKDILDNDFRNLLTDRDVIVDRLDSLVGRFSKV